MVDISKKVTKNITSHVMWKSEAEEKKCNEERRQSDNTINPNNKKLPWFCCLL